MKHINCACCNWSLAVASLEVLRAAGWRVMVKFGFLSVAGQRQGGLAMFWMCATCASSDVYARFVCTPGSEPKLDEIFAAQPVAPPDAYPAVGGVGEKHRDRVKPYCGRCGGGDPSLGDDLVHAPVMQDGQQLPTDAEMAEIRAIQNSADMLVKCSHCPCEYHRDLDACPLCRRPKPPTPITLLN